MDIQNYVKFQDVRKSYDGKNFVVKKLNLSIAKGEFLTMLGPSGSGKTTCLMMLAGFEDITDGEIYVGDKLIKNTAPYKRNIGVVFQNYALFPHMSIAENLAYPLKFRQFNKTDIDKRVKKYLSLVELEDFANRYPNQLSGGQKQRVALARALIYEPGLVLMDEPLGALDKNLREQMQYEIKKLHHMLDLTVVYVTHDQTEALTMSDRIAVFNDGVVQQLSDSETLYERPSNKFVAEFIGENNCLHGKIIKSINDNTLEVKVHDCIINALKVDIEEPNQNIYLSIRPEKIALNPIEIEKYENVFDAVIDDIIYIGDHSRIYVNFLDRNTDFIIKKSNFELDKEIKVGSKVKIAWKSKNCRALKDI